MKRVHWVTIAVKVKVTCFDATEADNGAIRQAANEAVTKCKYFTSECGGITSEAISSKVLP